jgi:hypothetical protein
MSIYGFAQKNINDYKYVIIPKSFQFSDEEDQYQLNSLTKFLFNKYGYEAYFIDEIPEDLKVNRCLGLKAEVSNEKKTMFKTKLEIKLKDCNDTVVMTSKIGESREKEYDKAYVAAIRDAFKTYQNLNYKYVASETVTQTQKVDEQPAQQTVIAVEEDLEPKKTDKNKDVVAEVEVVEITEETSSKSVPELYYAQAIKNGFQIVNSEPKVVMILLSTSAKDVFIVKDKNAIVFKENGKWQYSENNGSVTSAKALNIKF